ncbi:beta-fructofuranosidase 1-like [Phragmites australis]|uniref:beta-fructofuranosidase 1-like n=1 Tax=Phragmites australis TaxID=29695 RepID=UPI002D76A990|nr:beta-fructofuranosidase 1-like [Phragmites australis]
MIPAVPPMMDGAANNAILGTQAPLLPETDPWRAPAAAGQKRPGLSTALPVVVSAVLLLALATVMVFALRHVDGQWSDDDVAVGSVVGVAASRGVVDGVSEKSTAPLLGGAGALRDYAWTNAMLAWQHTAFHFQPPKNWMNDPNGPLYHKGWYHLFYQWNPDSAVWGNITWGHAVSRDLIHWLHLPLAMVPDHWYDANGVWSGSATRLPDGRIVMLYTGSTEESVQVQNLAEPADPSDPLLLEWVKSEANPVLVPPPGIGLTDFRDPTTAWRSSNDTAWRITIGSKDRDRAGLALVYRTHDFVHYELQPTLLHVVPGTGMWECVDFYPVAADPAAEDGLETSAAPGPGVKHVLKASLDDDKHDYYAIGTYDAKADTWTPDDAEIDVGVGLRYDYGKYYASKTFYDPVRRRRVLWGWIGETDSERTDILKGWASVQSVPRTVLLDTKTGSNLLQWPVVEVENLRMRGKSFDGVVLERGSVVPLDVGKATQLDIEAVFEVDASAVESVMEADVEYNCSTSAGAAGRGLLGPFGLLVLADEDLSEQTAVYFYLVKSTDGSLKTFFCQDELRSSKANDLVKRVYGSLVPVLDGEKLSVRILADHSIVESFAQRGRTCITSRVYPTKAIYDSARIFLFNNATNVHVTAKSLKIWELNSAYIRPYSGSLQ